MEAFQQTAMDQDKVTGEGLEPSTNGLTYPIGFRRPPETGTTEVVASTGVESLDYLFTIAGVPRIVSEAESSAPPDPCLLITQSPAFSNRHACRQPATLWCQGLSGCPSK